MFSRRGIHSAAAALTSSSATTAAARSLGSSSSSSSPTTQVWITISGDSLSPATGGGRPWSLRVPLDVSVDNQNSLGNSSHNTLVNSAAFAWGASGAAGHGALHRSRTLLAPPPPPPPHPAAAADDATREASPSSAPSSRGPYDVTIDEALLHHGDASHSSSTLLDLVRLLVDPDAGSNIESVSLRDFAAMAPKRQLRAVHNDQDCLNVLLSSERYQSERDARALRLAGVTTLGQWREQPDRVPLSAYGRGVLDVAYNHFARHRQQSQKDLVVAWLTRTIQRAVAEELMAPKQLTTGDAHAPSAFGSGSPPQSWMPVEAVGKNAAASLAAAPGAVGEHVDAAAATAAAVTAFTTTFASPEKKAEMSKAAAAKPQQTQHQQEQASQQKQLDEGDDEDDVEAVEEEDEEEKEAEVDTAASRRRGPRQRPLVPQVDKAKTKAAAALEEEVEEAVEEILDEVDAERGEEVDAEMATLMAEAEAILKRDGPPAPASAAKSTTAPTTKSTTSATAAAMKKNAPAPAAEAEEEEEVEEVVEEEEVEEEVEAAAEADANDKASEDAEGAAVAKPTPAVVTPPAEAAAPAPAATSPTSAQQKEKLARLAELMLKQFNTADGYLHPTNKTERAEQERRGDILVLDEDTAQVDPLAMFSAYHAATVTESDPVGVRALKTIWTSYNKHQVALEEARSEAAAEFYKHESVNALLYGSVLMRALAREEPVVVLEGTSSLPHYGFPLVSSDTRPFDAAGPASGSKSTSSSGGSGVTDMTPGKVPTAMQAYKIFFSDKEKRFSPFRPAIDRNAGCSVVRLSGTTLHLYYTSTKDHVMEEEVRMPFAEVMLGMLHLLRQKVLPRVNVVHYHLIATKVADAAADTDFLLRSTATLDLTNPFTKEEHTRLKALAAPLGMAEEMDEFRCIDDLVMEIEDNSGASVVHSLLHNREDLEATLTATLAQLLPEEAEVEGTAAEAATVAAGGAEEEETGLEEGAEEEVEVVEEEEEDGEVEAAPVPASRKGKLISPSPAAAAAARAAAASSPPTARRTARTTKGVVGDAEEDEEVVAEAAAEAAEDEEYGEEEEVEVVEEEDDLNEEEDETDGAAVKPARGAHKTPSSHHAPASPATAARKAAHHPAPPVAPTTRRSAAAAAAATRAGVDDEEAELEEAIYTQWQKQKEQQHHRGAAGAAHKKAAAAEAGEELDEEEVEEFEEEEEDEVEAAAPVAAHKSRSPAAAAATKASPSAKTAAAATLTEDDDDSVDEEEDELEEEEDALEEMEEGDEEEMEVVTAPVLPRSPAGRRAVPVLDEEVEEEEEEEVVAAPPPPRRAAAPQTTPAAPASASRARVPPPSPRSAAAMEEDPAYSTDPIIRATVNAAAAAAAEKEEVEEVEEEEAPPPLPQVRTRRGAARRHSARSRVAVPTDVDDTAHGSGQVEEEAAAPADEDQWFRKKPKRRYFE